MCTDTLLQYFYCFLFTHDTGEAPVRHRGDAHQHLHFADVLHSVRSFLHLQSSATAAAAASRIRGGQTAFTLQGKEEEVLLKDQNP